MSLAPATLQSGGGYEKGNYLSPHYPDACQGQSKGHCQADGKAALRNRPREVTTFRGPSI